MPDSTNPAPSPISRRQFLQAAAASGIASQVPAALAQPAVFRPNIIYIHSHDTGRYTQPFGQPVPTPALQKLAEEGILFRNAFSAAPTCSPSRSALLTGICPHQNGMLGLAHLGWGLNDYNQVIIHTLAKHGYTSVLAGLQHIAKDPHTIGYDTYLPHKSEMVADVIPGAIQFLEAPPKQPFFLDVGFHETHRKFHDPTPADNPAFTQPPPPVPDTPETRLDMAAFHASARALDGGVAALLAALAKAGLAENTLVISTTDHGIAFPEMKCNLTAYGTGVHLIMRGPRGFSGGKPCTAMISQLDVFPTICDYLSIEPPAWLQGKSFLPVLRGDKAEINDEVFAEVTYHAAYEPKRSVRTHRFNYIKRFDGRTHEVLPNVDDGPSKTVWLKAGWQQLALVHPEALYDVVFDPAEQDNLALDPNFAAELADMRARLARWMERTNDPLLRGPVPLPAGYKTTSPDAISPGAVKPSAKGEAA